MEEIKNIPNEQIVEVTEDKPSIFKDATQLNAFIQQVPGLAEICDFANLPDDQFVEINTYLTVTMENAYQDEAFKREIKRLTDSLSPQDFQMMNLAFDTITEEIEKIDCLTEKKTFLHLLINNMSDGIKDMYNHPYDILVPLQLLHDDVKEPEYANPTDAGADVFATEDFTIPAHSFGNQIASGLAIALPRGWQVEVRPRSGLSKKTRMRISNTPGTIDGGYRDEIGILVDNFGEDLSFKCGDKIAQLVLEPIYRMKFVRVDNVKSIGEDRGGGFGHTDGVVK